METQTWKDTLRPFIPKSVLTWKKRIHDDFFDPETRTTSLMRFRWTPRSQMDFGARSNYAANLLRIHGSIRCAHTHAEIVEIITAILESAAEPSAVIVEAGCFLGGSTAKLSLAAKAMDRKLVVFDSFEGLPAPQDFEARNFSPGEYCGQLAQVQKNVREFGDLSVCEFVKGWFCETLPRFERSVAVAFVDVDLVSSVKDCLRHLYPRLVPGGMIFSHDGHLPSVVDQALGNEEFWREVEGPRPNMTGLRTKKLVRIQKPST